MNRGLKSIISERRKNNAKKALITMVVVTMFEDHHSVFAAMQAGARGYLLKGAKYAEMLRAVRDQLYR